MSLQARSSLKKHFWKIGNRRFTVSTRPSADLYRGNGQFQARVTSQRSVVGKCDLRNAYPYTSVSCCPLQHRLRNSNGFTQRHKREGGERKERGECSNCLARIDIFNFTTHTRARTHTLTPNTNNISWATLRAVMSHQTATPNKYYMNSQPELVYEKSMIATWPGCKIVLNCDSRRACSQLKVRQMQFI